MICCAMMIDNTSVDPYRPTRGYYECSACGTRTVSDTRVELCPDCGHARVQNIAVPRE